MCARVFVRVELHRAELRSLARSLGCVSVRSLIGLHVRVPKCNADFIYPLVSTQAGRQTGRRSVGRSVDCAHVECWSGPTKQFDPGSSIAIPEGDPAKSSAPIDR